jgi:hypothetical protein
MRLPGGSPKILSGSEAKGGDRSHRCSCVARTFLSAALGLCRSPSRPDIIAHGCDKGEQGFSPAGEPEKRAASAAEVLNCLCKRVIGGSRASALQENPKSERLQPLRYLRAKHLRRKGRQNGFRLCRPEPAPPWSPAGVSARSQTQIGPVLCGSSNFFDTPLAQTRSRCYKNRTSRAVRGSQTVCLKFESLA